MSHGWAMPPILIANLLASMLDIHRELMVAGEPVLHVSKNWASWLVFYWVNPLMARGSNRQLQASDLFQLPKALLPSTCSNRLWGIWADVRTLTHSVHHGIHAHVKIDVKACGSAFDGEGLLNAMGQMCQQLLACVEQSNIPCLLCTSVHEARYPADHNQINGVRAFQLPAQGTASVYFLNVLLYFRTLFFGKIKQLLNILQKTMAGIKLHTLVAGATSKDSADS